MTIWKILLLIAAIAAMWSIVPLMVWAGSGDWRRAVEALRDYAAIMGTLVAVVGGLAVVMLIAEHGLDTMLALITGH